MSVWWIFYLACKTLTSDLIFTTLLAYSADDKLVIAYFFFSQKTGSEISAFAWRFNPLCLGKLNMLSVNSFPA